MKIRNYSFKNIISNASGTCGYGFEVNNFFDPNLLGCFVGKSLTLKPQQGNKQPRMHFNAHTVYNAIGLQNEGIDHFVNQTSVLLKKIFKDTNYIVSVYANDYADFCTLCEKLTTLDFISGVELNLSCPNVKNNLSLIHDLDLYQQIIRDCKKIIAPKLLFCKLTVNFTEVVALSCLAQKAQADGVVISNTLSSLPLDQDLNFQIANQICGASNHLLKDSVLAACYKTTQATSLPVIACGGINTYQDVLEYQKAGASLVQVGSANFFDIKTMPSIIAKLAAADKQ